MRRLGVVVVFAACSAPPEPPPVRPPPPLPPPPAVVAPKLTLAQEVLAIEDRYYPTRPEMAAELATLTRDVKAKLATMSFAGVTEEARAEQTLGAIDLVFVEHHFVYPGFGYVESVHDGLAETVVDDAGREALRARAENESVARQVMIGTAPRFHVADCDVFSVLYMSIGEELGLPIAMVDLPGGHSVLTQPHNYVVWTLGDGSHVTWEPDEGGSRWDFAGDRYELEGPLSRESAEAKRISAVAMTHDEVLGYWHWATGLQWEQRGVTDLARDEFAAAAKLWPTPKPLNSLAWLLSTSSDPDIRDPKRAIALGEQLATLWPADNNLDTAAAAYAADGQWDRAVAMEQRAFAAAPATDRAAYDAVVARYQKCQPVIDLRANEMHARMMSGFLTDPAWGPYSVPSSSAPKPTPAPLADACKH